MIQAFNPDWCVPPADTLLECLAERDWTVRDLAERMGDDVDVNELAILLLIHTQADYPEMMMGEQIANGLEKALGVPASFWLALDQRFREAAKAGKTIIRTFDT